MSSDLRQGTSLDNMDLKCIELKKFQLTNGQELPNGVHNVLAVQNDLQVIACVLDGHLSIIPFGALLSYEYNKKVVNEIDANFTNFVARIPLGNGWNSPSFVSIGGHHYGLTLAVLGHIGGGVLSGLFFSLEELLSQRNNAKPFGSIDLRACGDDIIDLAWHPEHCDNLLAFATNDGTLVSVQCDSATRQAVILNSMAGHKVKCLCWSPKGKQLVVGCANGDLCQFKHDKGRMFELAKRIPPNASLGSCYASKIHWHTSSLFLVVFISMDPNCETKRHVSLVHVPPKTTTAVFVDFGPVCMDSISIADQSHLVDHIGLITTPDTVLIASSICPDVGFIGSVDTNALNDPTKWAQWALDDSARVELPMNKTGDESFPRGVSLANGVSSPLIVLSETEKYANAPILYVLTSQGLLCPYAIVNRLHAIKLHSKMAKTPLKLDVTSSLNEEAPPKVAPLAAHISQQQHKTLPVPPVANVTPQSKEQSSYATTSPVALNISTHGHQPQPVVRTTHRLDTSSSDESQRKNVYEEAAQKEVYSFNEELKRRVSSLRKTLDASVGSLEELEDLQAAVEQVTIKCDATETKLATDNEKLSEVKRELMQILVRAEDAKSICNRETNADYLKLAKSRSLHPVHAKKFADLCAQFQYISSQLDELDLQLEKEWLEMRCKKTGNAIPSPSSVAQSKYSAILQTVLSNEKLISLFEAQLERAQSLSGTKPLAKNISAAELTSLEHLMNRSSLRGDALDENLCVSRPMCTSTREALWTFLEMRHRIPVRRAPAPDKSIYMKLAELDTKQTKLNEKSKHHSHVSSSRGTSASRHDVSHVNTLPASNCSPMPSMPSQQKTKALDKAAVRIPETIKDRLNVTRTPSLTISSTVSMKASQNSSSLSQPSSVTRPTLDKSDLPLLNDLLSEPAPPTQIPKDKSPTGLFASESCEKAVVASQSSNAMLKSILKQSPMKQDPLPSESFPSPDAHRSHSACEPASTARVTNRSLDNESTPIDSLSKPEERGFSFGAALGALQAVTGTNEVKISSSSTSAPAASPQSPIAQVSTSTTTTTSPPSFVAVGASEFLSPPTSSASSTLGTDFGSLGFAESPKRQDASPAANTNPFGAFGSSTAATATFGGSTAFGSSPVPLSLSLSQSTFGGGPTFATCSLLSPGSGSGFGGPASFGAAPAFGSPATFGNNVSAVGVTSGFDKYAEAPSFGTIAQQAGSASAFASFAQPQPVQFPGSPFTQQQQPTSFGHVAQGQGAPALFGAPAATSPTGFGPFGVSGSQAASGFAPSKPSQFTQYR